MARLFSIDGDGIKNIDLPQYPDEAWTWYSGKPQNGAEQTLYQRVAYLFQCAQVTAAATSQVPFALIRLSDGEEVDNSADWKNVVGWLPNPRRTINKVELALYIWGRAYSYPSKTKKGKDLQYILPTSVEPVIDGVEGLTGFTRTYTGGVKKWTVEDLIYYWEDDPFVEIGPPQSSRFMAAASAASVLHEMDKYIAEFIARGGVLPTMLMVKGSPPPGERERIETYWDKFIRGWFRVAGKIFNAEGFDVKTVGDGLASLKDANFTAQERENITVASRVPMSIIMSDQETYAGAMASRLNWFQNSIIPNFDFIAGTWNEQLLNRMGYRMESRPETMDAYQEDEVNRAAAYASYVGTGMLPSIAAQVVGIELPPDTDYAALDPQPEPETPEAEDTPEDDAEDMAEEAEEAPAKAAPALSLAAITDLQIWQRKAIKAIATGQPVTFSTTAIPGEVYATITAQLAQAQTVDDVRAVFAGVTGQPQAETRTDDAAMVKGLLEGIRLGVEALKHGDHDQQSHAGGGGSGRASSIAKRIGTKYPVVVKDKMSGANLGGPDADGQFNKDTKEIYISAAALEKYDESTIAHIIAHEEAHIDIENPKLGDYRLAARAAIIEELGEDEAETWEDAIRSMGGVTPYGDKYLSDKSLPIKFAIRENLAEVAGSRAAGKEPHWFWAQLYDSYTARPTKSLALKSYTPPADVRAAARRGLELREKHGVGGLTTQEAGAQGIGSGVQRASDLASGDAVSLETVRKMAAFFSRHEKNKSGGEDDAGYIAWQLWGGDAGRAWAEGIIREIEEKEGDK